MRIGSFGTGSAANQDRLGRNQKQLQLAQMATRSRHGIPPTGVDNAQLRLARLGMHTAQGVPLGLPSRSGRVLGYGTLQLPAAHPSIPVPMHAYNYPRRGGI